MKFKNIYSIKKLILSFILKMIWLSAAAQTDRNEFFAGITYHPSFTFKTTTPGNFEYMLKGSFKFKNDNAFTTSACLAFNMEPITHLERPEIVNYRVISILTGYKKNIKKFYVESQIGVGIFSKDYKDDDIGVEPDGRLNDGAIIYGIESGFYLGKRFQVFIKYHCLNSFTTFSDNVPGLLNDRTYRYGGVGISFKLD